MALGVELGVYLVPTLRHTLPGTIEMLPRGTVEYVLKLKISDTSLDKC